MKLLMASEAFPALGFLIPGRNMAMVMRMVKMMGTKMVLVEIVDESNGWDEDDDGIDLGPLLVVAPSIVMMDSASLANSRELKGRTLTATFTPDISPLVLAAHTDNYEVTDILSD